MVLPSPERQNSATLYGKIKRLPADVRQTIKRALAECHWQSLTKEFSIESVSQLDREGLDLVVACVDDGYDDLKKDVRTHMDMAKLMHCTGRTETYKGKNHQGFHNKFYRYYLFVRANTNGTYDVFLAYVCRKEEFDVFLTLKKILAGTMNVVQSVPVMVWDRLMRNERAAEALGAGHVDGAQAAARRPPQYSIPSDLGDKLMEFEFVESLIERGTLVPENEEGTQFKLVIN